MQGTDGTVHVAGEFIEVAEATGLILSLGERVLSQAVADCVAWQRARPAEPLTMRINLAAQQLREPGLLTTLDRLMADHGADPGAFCVEITETTMLLDSPSVQANLRGIADRGIAIALDDFGTGYGALTYLQRYPVHLLKLDRGFVQGVANSRHDHELVAGIVSLARRLGVPVTAEGVETVEQERALRHLGCPTAQGFLYSPAVPFAELPAVVDRISAR
jgi:EAL domain-containing protein (putative c-di-GMP-specific phosphodiesterase class I)